MLGLILIGLSVVTLPLVIALVNSLGTVKELSERSEQLVSDEVAFATRSDHLADQLMAMERNARQFAIVSDDELRRSYLTKHEQLTGMLSDLAALPAAAAHIRDLTRIEQDMAVVANAMQRAESSDQLQTALARFDDSTPRARDLATGAEQTLNRALLKLDRDGSKARQNLRWQASALFPALAIAIMIITALISRPVRRLRDAIRDLGALNTTQPVAIGGPRELADLGEQLDWLRNNLRAAEAQKDLFLRQMSHELKTPLASIREGVELLKDGSVGTLSEAQDEVAGILRDNSLELQHLIENLLSFSALHNRQQSSIDRKAIELEKLLEQLLRRYQLLSRNRELTFDIDLQSAEVVADRELMRLALDNLISNAVKYSPTGGIIALTSRQTRQGFEIDVSDQGPGIAIAERERVFAPFYQGHTPVTNRCDATSRHTETSANPTLAGHLRGTGIGLSIVHECMQVHGGNVKIIESNTPGTTFKLAWPHHV